jgi:hypothetical protein
MQAMANPAVMQAAMKSIPSGGDAPESECEPTPEQWAAKIQKETIAFKKKLYLLLSKSEYSEQFFGALRDSLVNTIKSLPESQYLVRLADQEIFRSLIEQFKLDDDFKKIFSYKLLGGQGENNADKFLIGKIELLINQINKNTSNNEQSFTLLLKEQRKEYLEKVNQNAKDHDIKNENNKQKGGKVTKTRKLKRIKIRINTKKKRSRAQSKRSLRRRQRKRRYPRKTMRGGDGMDMNTEDVKKLLNSVNSATATGNTNTSGKNEKKPAETGSNPESEEGETDENTDSKENADAPAADIDQDEEPNNDKAVEKNYTQDLLKRLTEMDATNGDFRNIILNLIQIACNITLEEKKDELTNILSNKMQIYIQNVYNNLNYSTYDVFGYLIFYSFLFDDKENRNTIFGDFVDGEIVKLKNNGNLNFENVKNIFQTNILETKDKKKNTIEKNITKTVR